MMRDAGFRPVTLQSLAALLAFDGKPALKLADLPPKAYARLADLAVDYKLRVARPTAAPQNGWAAPPP